MLSTLNMKWMSHGLWQTVKTTKVVYHSMPKHFSLSLPVFLRRCLHTTNNSQILYIGWRERFGSGTYKHSLTLTHSHIHFTDIYNYCQSHFHRYLRINKRESCSFVVVWAKHKNRLKQKWFPLLNNKYKMPSHPLIQFSTVAAAAAATATPYEINTMSKESHNLSDATFSTTIHKRSMCLCMVFVSLSLSQSVFVPRTKERMYVMMAKCFSHRRSHLRHFVNYNTPTKVEAIALH